MKRPEFTPEFEAAFEQQLALGLVDTVAELTEAEIADEDYIFTELRYDLKSRGIDITEFTQEQQKAIYEAADAGVEYDKILDTLCV